MKLYFWLIFLLGIIPLSAQNCNLKLQGKVIDFHNGMELEQVEIKQLSTNRIVYTNEDGNFVFDKLCSGTHEFLLKHHDCDDTVMKIDIHENKIVEWFLEHHIIELEQLEAHGAVKREISTAVEQHIHIKEIREKSAETLGSALKTISGVSALESGNSIIKPMIHGLHSSRLIILNGGTRQEDMEWGVEHSPNIDLNSFHDLRVIKGSAALRYGGDAIAGVVLAEHPILPRKNEWKGETTLTGIYNGKGGAGNLLVHKGFNSPLAFQLQTSYKKHGDFKSPDYYLRNSGAETKAFFGEVGYNTFENKLNLSYSYYNTDLGILKAAHIGNLNDLVNAINSDIPLTNNTFSYKLDKPYQHISHHLAQIKGEKRFKNLGKLEANYAFQFNKRQEFDNRLGEVKETPSMDTELTTQSTEAVFSLDKWDKTKVYSGVNWAYQRSFSLPETRIKRLIPDYQMYKIGAFAGIDIDLTQEIKFTGGLRYDFRKLNTKKYYYKLYWEKKNYDKDFQNNIIGDFNNQWLVQFGLDNHAVSTSLGLGYKPNAYREINLNYGLANRAPNPAELFSEGLHHSAFSIELGDVRLQQEKAHKISLNYYEKWNILSDVSLNVLGYFNYIKDYIYQIPTGLEYTIRGSFPVWSFEQINASIIGADLDLDIDWNKKISSKSSFAYLYANDLSNNLPLINMPPWELNQSIKYDFQTKNKAFVSMEIDWVGKQNRFPDYNFEIDVIENNMNIRKLVDISSSEKSYLLLGVKVGISFPINKYKANLNLHLKNISNTKYRNYLNRFRYYADEMGRQIQLQLNIKF